MEEGVHVGYGVDGGRPGYQHLQDRGWGASVESTALPGLRFGGRQSPRWAVESLWLRDHGCSLLNLACGREDPGVAWAQQLITGWGLGPQVCVTDGWRDLECVGGRGQAEASSAATRQAQGGGGVRALLKGRGCMERPGVQAGAFPASSSGSAMCLP